jgi:prophage regulatory protein
VSPEDLVGIAEIAAMLGVTGRTAHNYSLRLGFPEPYGRTAGGRVWLRADVEAWAKEALPLRIGRPRKESRGGKGERPGNHDTA